MKDFVEPLALDLPRASLIRSSASLSNGVKNLFDVMEVVIVAVIMSCFCAFLGRGFDVKVLVFLNEMIVGY